MANHYKKRGRIMKKRFISMALAVLLALGLCVPAFAAEEDLFEQSWDLALSLQDPTCALVTIESSADLTGTASGAVDADVSVTMEEQTAAYQDGERMTVVAYSAVDPIVMMGGMAIFAPNGSAYAMSVDNDNTDGTLVKYSSVQDGTFADLSQLALYFAALGDNEMNAAQTTVNSSEYLVYDTTVADIKGLLDICLPELLKGYDEAALADAGAQVQIDFYLYSTECEADITIMCPQLGEAMLKQLEGAESVADASLEIEIEITAMTEEYSSYGDYRFTDEVAAEIESEYGIQISEQDGEAPVCGTLKDFLWSIYEPGYSEVAERESAKDALRAALSGNQAGEETPEEETAE